MSRLRSNQITNENANGAPNFPHGLTVTGIVTASTTSATASQIVVGSAVTANSQGIDVTGVVTATSFKGDGSNLTGIDATQIATGNTKVQTVASRVDTKIDNVGILTVTSSGVNVTGIVTANSFVAGGTAVGTFTEGSVISLTSGSNNLGVSVDTILSTTKRIEVFILGMSLTGNSEFKFQLRNASGTVSSGYVGSGGYVSNASYANELRYTDSWGTFGMGSSGGTWSGHMTIKNYNNHYWYINGDFWNDSGPTHYWTHGHCNATAQITGFRFDKRGGNFDAGEFRLNQYS